MEAMVHDKPHKCRTFAEHCSKAFVLGTSTEHYRCWKFWMVSTRATHISGTAFFKHRYLTNPSVTPEDQIIVAAARLTDAIQGTITANMHTSTLKSLGDLQSIFHNAAKGYDTHQSKAEVSITCAVQHHTPVSPRTPDNNTPTKSRFAPPRVQPNVTPNIARNLFGQEPPTEQMLSNSPKGGIQSPLHVRHNTLPNPNSPDKQPQPHCLQRIAELGILTKPAPINAPANNTCSQAQVRTITQEAILACISTYSNITNLRLTAANAARKTFPLEMLNAVLDMDTGKLMEMKHLLVNPKYKKVLGKLYTTDLGRLAQGIRGVSKGTDTIVSYDGRRSPLTESKTSRIDACASTIAQRRMTPIKLASL
jgi:hypothetical protein